MSDPSLHSPLRVPVRGYDGRYEVAMWDTGYRTKTLRRRLYRFTIYYDGTPVAGSTLTRGKGMLAAVATAKAHSEGKPWTEVKSQEGQ